MTAKYSEEELITKIISHKENTEGVQSGSVVKSNEDGTLGIIVKYLEKDTWQVFINAKKMEVWHTNSFTTTDARVNILGILEQIIK